MTQRLLVLVVAFAVVLHAQAQVVLAFSLKPARGIPVLMYHHLAPRAIANKSGHAVVITPELMESHMRYLKHNGYSSITPRDLAEHLLDGKPLPPRPVLITSDDGYESNYVYAFPILKKYNMKATIYLITAMISDNKKPFDPAVPSYLNWSQVKEMAESGLVSFESHTHNLHFTDSRRRYGMEVVTPEFLEQDIKTSVNLIKEKTGQVPVSLAYPYGHFKKRYRTALEKAGIRIAFTVREGLVRPYDNPYELSRITVYPFHTDLGRVLRGRPLRLIQF